MTAMMREKFQQHHQPDEESLRKLWADCLFVLDTSSLLNIYRYNNKTRQDFFKTLKFLEKRLWVPYQVAREFYNNRINVIIEQKKKYSEFIETLDASLKSIRDGKFSKSTFLDIENIENAIKPGIEKAHKIIKEQQSKHPDLILKDPYLNELVNIIGNNIGNEPSLDEFNKLCCQAEGRITQKIPPGYLDSQKPSPQKYGDALIWFEILEHSRINKKSIIFITDDDKEDWWLKIEGKKLGPRPELREEFKKLSSFDFHIINPSYLLENAEKQLNISIPKESIDNAKNVSNELNSILEKKYYEYFSLQKNEKSNVSSFWDSKYKDIYNTKDLISKAVLDWLILEFSRGTIHKGYGMVDYLIEENSKTTAIQIIQLVDTKFLFLKSILSNIYKKAENLDSQIDEYLLIFVFNNDVQARTAYEQLTKMIGDIMYGKMVVGFIDKYEKFNKIN